MDDVKFPEIQKANSLSQQVKNNPETENVYSNNPTKSNDGGRSQS